MAVTCRFEGCSEPAIAGNRPYCRWHRYELDKAANTAGCLVYFVLAPSVFRLKIGTTTGKTLHGRMRDLAAFSPVPLVLLGVIRGGVSVERWCHFHCVDANDHHEWFRWDDRTKAFVELVLGHGENAAEVLCNHYYRRDRSGARSYGSVRPLPRAKRDVDGYKSDPVLPLGACQCASCVAFIQESAR